MDTERWDAIRAKIGAQRSVWQPLEKELSDARKAFSSGKGIEWSDVQQLRETWRSNFPFIDSEGKPFVLYIYDQASASYHSSWRSRNGYTSDREWKFHFCWCSTLETMSANGRRARYKAKHDVDNDTFLVNLGGEVDQKKQMRVCKNCLSQMDYQGFARTFEPERTRLYEAFDIGFFFQENTPTGLLHPTHQHHTGRYPSNWPLISRKIRDERGNKCEECSRTDGLHVHHINGVKDDCRPSNLKVLCFTHHAQQPMHEHMRALR